MKTQLQICRYDKSYKSFHYYLKQTSVPDKPTAIILVLTMTDACREMSEQPASGRIRVYTHLKIEPQYWDKTNSQCFDTKMISPRVLKRTRIINTKLGKIKAELEMKDQILAENGEFISSSAVREIVEAENRGAVARENSPERRNIKALKPSEILRGIATSRDVGDRGLSISDATTSTYLETCQRLDKFLKESKFYLSSLDDCDREFFRSFRSWLMNCRIVRNGTEMGYTASTVSSTLSVLRNLLRKANESGYSVNDYYKSMKPDNSGQNCAEKIFLNEKELKRLAQIFVKSDTERNIRDMFILASYTALRISDVNRLDRAEIDDSTIRLFQQKTGGRVSMPILKEISQIIRDYKNCGFPKLTNGYSNKIIKRLAVRAGIDTLVSVKECRGGVTSVSLVPKSSLISFHTARRSCITNLYLRGYSINYLMGLSGHSSIQSFQRYVRSTSDDLTQVFMKELKKRGDI